MTDTHHWPVRFFKLVTKYPRFLLLMSVVYMAFSIYGLTYLFKDTSADAFIESNNPALIYRDQVKEIFGLNDPMVIMVTHTEHPSGVFNPKTLFIVNELTRKVESLPNVDPQRVVSLATEKNIRGDQYGMVVNDFFDPFPKTQELSDRLKQAVESFPLYRGTLVAENNKATMIVAEMLNESEAEKTYQQFIDLVQQYSADQSHEFHVAGEGAITGYMGSYIDADAQRLNPLAGLVITIILFLTYRTIRATWLPNVIVLATVSGALGLMSYLGIAFFVITNAIPVILIGIAVADSIHVFGQYYEEKNKYPTSSSRDIVVKAMTHIWRPITLTTFTTAAGFMGLYFASVMPPFKYMGLFSAFGVMVAWVYSMVFLPASLSLLKVKPSPAYKYSSLTNHNQDQFSVALVGIGQKVLQHPRRTVFLFMLVIVIGIVGAVRIKVDEDRIDTFHKDEPIYIADKKINTFMNGTNTLDIIIETGAFEALFEPKNLFKVEKLQSFIESLSNVGGSTSVVDYIKQMNRSMNEDQSSYYRIPEDKNLVAQLFLLYSASNDPTDFEEEVDYDYRMANIRVNMTTGLYSEIKQVIDTIQQYIDHEFNDEEIKASLSGRVNLNYHWIKTIGDSHFKSVFFALCLVFIMASLFFKSLTAGLFAMIPVVSSILFIYAVMGTLGITIGVGTSMFASVAIGLGVDFAIHSIDRIKAIFKDNPKHDIDKNLMQFFPTTGRALFFNFLAISLGFGVLMLSDVVPLFRFGAIVALSVSISFLASITLLPALLKIARPSFLEQKNDHINQGVTV